MEEFEDIIEFLKELEDTKLDRKIRNKYQQIINVLSSFTETEKDRVMELTEQKYIREHPEYLELPTNQWGETYKKYL